MGASATAGVDSLDTAVAPGAIDAPSGRRTITRLGAFAIHLALSLLVFSSLLFAMLAWWYPGELFFLDGGWAGLRLVALVDLVLGPALTLLLFKPGKPSLVFDLSVVAIIQVAALGYGFATTHAWRTEAVVFADRAFWTVSAAELAEGDATLRELEAAPRDVDELASAARDTSPGAGGGKAVPFLRIPSPAPGDSGRFLEDLFAGFPELRLRSDRYTAIERGWRVPASVALDPDDLGSGVSPSVVRAAMAAADVPAGDLQLVPFKSRFDDGIALYDPARASIVDYLTSAELARTEDPAIVGAEVSEDP